jgi:hypothetical protein
MGVGTTSLAKEGSDDWLKQVWHFNKLEGDKYEISSYQG